MKPTIAVFGNERNFGYTIAADLTLAGYKVNFFELPEFQDKIEQIKEIGGILLTGEKEALLSRQNGIARPHMVTTNPQEALEDVDVIFADLPASDYETRFKAIIPYLRDGQIIHFNTYGAWGCLRVARILKQMGKRNIILTESPVPVYGVRSENGHIISKVIRGEVPVAAFPSKKNREAFDVLKSIYPCFEMAQNALQTNFENVNLVLHPGIVILNIGYFDRAKEDGERVGFYATGNTLHTGILVEAHDREKIQVCKAYEVPGSPIREQIIRYYNSRGNTVYEAIQNCKYYQEMLPLPADIWIQWLKIDLLSSVVPFALLADLAGIPVPVHKAAIEIFGAVLETNFWETGLTLDKLGLAGLTKEEVIRYVTEG